MKNRNDMIDLHFHSGVSPSPRWGRALAMMNKANSGDPALQRRLDAFGWIQRKKKTDDTP